MSKDEGEFLVKMSGKEGDTFLPTARTMWAGADASVRNADRSRTRVIPAHEYRTCLLVALQDEIASKLMTDAEISKGTPQRFLWTRLVDPYILPYGEQPDLPEPLVFDTSNVGWMNGDSVSNFLGLGEIDMIYVPEVLNIVNRLLYDEISGKREDGHLTQLRCRIACLFALFDGYRQTVNMEDWDLAGVIIQDSEATRNELLEKAAKSRIKASENKARVQGYELDTMHATADAAAVRRVANGLMRKFGGRGIIKQREIDRAVARRDREQYQKLAIQLLVDEGVIQEMGEHKGWEF